MLHVLSSSGSALMAGQDTATITGFRSDDGDYTAIEGGYYHCARSTP